jgi:hypothetical protein
MLFTTKSFRTKLLYTTLFAIAMAYLESAIVVYLRMLYYPQGFEFPLIDIPRTIWWTEMGREAATIVMLGTVARILAQHKREWFAYFAINFGIWDIWYYVWLKILIDWPASVLDWDLLFLIPQPWVGPVLAPVLVSVCLIIAGIYILKYDNLHLKKIEWILEIICGLIIILSFLTQTDRLAQGLPPENYPWIIFLAGLISGLFIFTRRFYYCLTSKL